VGYLLARAGGAKIEAAFLRSIVHQTVTPALPRRRPGHTDSLTLLP
jgi:hypothetical protein